MSNRMDALKAATHAYIGTMPCGCTVAATVDIGDKRTAMTVQEFISEGLTVDRVPMGEARIRIQRCIHEPRPQRPESVEQTALFV